MEGESMSEWKEVRLGDVCNLYSGGTPNKNNKTYWNGNIPWISAKSMYGDYIEDADLYITEEGLSNGSRLAPKGSILILTRGSGLYNRIPICYTLKDVAFNQDVKRIESKDEDLYPNDLLYYILYANKKTISSIIESTGIGAGKIDTDRFLNLPITIPPVYIQKDLMELFNAIFSKIETNNKLNEKLEEMAQAIFKSWFVDFEPFKDKPFHETELGMIPEGWEVGSILDIAELFDSQRKPLSSMEREYMKGKYPYYGATSIMDYIDKYIFDGTYLLMGEDGSVVKENGNPYLQYVWGKFWPNNHAHVMQGRNGFSTEMLYCLLSITDVSSIVTGAVQMKISQRSMSRLLTVIPSKSVCKKFNTIIRPIFDIIKRIREENDRLASLRDTLLPRLMSGEIKI